MTKSATWRVYIRSTTGSVGVTVFLTPFAVSTEGGACGSSDLAHDAIPDGESFGFRCPPGSVVTVTRQHDPTIQSPSVTDNYLCIAEMHVCTEPPPPSRPPLPSPPLDPPSPETPFGQPESPPPPAPIWPLPTETENLQTYRDRLTAHKKQHFFMIYVGNAGWMNDRYPLIPDNTFWSNSWTTDLEGREFFMRLVRDLGHGYAHANAGKPTNWYTKTSSSDCNDWLDPAQNYFSTSPAGRGYDVDGVFDYGMGDGMVHMDFKFHAIGYVSAPLIPTAG